MKKLSYVLIVLAMSIDIAFSDVGKFESFSNDAMRNQYTICDSVVRNGCINLNTTSRPSGGLALTKTYVGSDTTLTNNEYVAGVNNSYFNPNDNDFDRNAIVNFNITNSNQTLMQTYSADLNPEYTPKTYILDKVVIPVKTTENSTLNVGANKIEFNLSY